MALAKAFSAAVHGIDAYLVEVEVDVGRGLAGQFPIVGLPDAAVQEARERGERVQCGVRRGANSWSGW
jgi:magnesium chelatase family protein